MADGEVNPAPASCNPSDKGHDREICNDSHPSSTASGADEETESIKGWVREPWNAEKESLLRELEKLRKREEELKRQKELRDLERQVEAARKRIQDLEMETAPPVTQTMSEGKGKQPQYSLMTRTPSETGPSSGTGFDSPTSLLPQNPAGHSAGCNVLALPRGSVTAASSKGQASSSHRPIAETTSTRSLHEVDRLKYYREVDGGKLQSLNDMDISELWRLAAKPRDEQQGVEQISIAHVYYSIFLKTGAMEDLDCAIQQANGEMPINDDSPDYARYLRDLIAMLVKKYQLTNLLGDLEEAILRAQEMVATTPLDHTDRSVRVGDWICMMLMKFGHTGSQDDLDEATIMAREVGALVSVNDSGGRGLKIEVGIPV